MIFCLLFYGSYFSAALTLYFCCSKCKTFHSKFYIKLKNRVSSMAEKLFFYTVEQEFMHACIHASTHKMHLSLLVVLDGVHSQKKVGKWNVSSRGGLRFETISSQRWEDARGGSQEGFVFMEACADSGGDRGQLCDFVGSERRIRWRAVRRRH